MSVGLEEVQQLAGVGHPETEGWGVGRSWLLVKHPEIVNVKFQNLRKTPYFVKFKFERGLGCFVFGMNFTACVFATNC